jgi:hypothetical protein
MADATFSGTEVQGDGVSAVRRATRAACGAKRPGRGWLSFAVVMFLIAATFNTVHGIAAIANDDHFTADELLFGDEAREQTNEAAPAVPPRRRPAALRNARLRARLLRSTIGRSPPR